MRYLFLFLPFFFVYAQNENNWETFTYMNDVKDIVYYQNYIWAVTTGGAYKFNIEDSTFQKFTNTDGLASLNLSAVATDNFNNVIFGSANGLLSFYNTTSSQWTTKTALKGQSVTDIFSKEDTLWVAADNGVGVYVYDNNNYEFRDFYDHLPINPGKTYKILCFGNNVYFATENGLLYAPSNFVKYNLKSSDNWDTYTSNDILKSDDVRTLVVINDSLYIGTAGGVTRLSKDQWHDDAFNWTGGIVRHIAVINDTLHFFRQGDYFIYNGTSWERTKIYGIVINAITLDKNGDLWLAFNKSGLLNWNWNTSFLVDGPASNYVGIVKKDRKGNLWISSGKFKLPYSQGFYKYDFNNWENYKFSNNLWTKKNNSVYMYEDRDGLIWMGNWNGGITALSDTGFIFYHSWDYSGELTVSTNEESQSLDIPPISEKRINCLSQSKEMKNLMVVPNFLEDSKGNFFLVNYIAADQNYITIIPRKNNQLQINSCSEWYYYGSNIGLNSNEGQISCLEFDDYGRLWMGTFQNRLLVWDLDGSISNPTDDSVIRYDTNDGLYNITILALKNDHDGVMWIGTAAGLNSYDGQNIYKHVGDKGPVENKINYIFVDDYNNKWFATDGGLSILEGDKSPWDVSAWTHYTTENSGLANNIVNSVYVDSKKGEAYIGTEGGLSIFRGAFAQIRPNYEELSGGPNPFFLDNSSGSFVITNLMVNSTVKILNINGKLIRILSEGNGNVIGSRATWDGRDSNNNLVSSGIYIYMVYSEDGKVSKGKLSVIRK